MTNKTQIIDFNEKRIEDLVRRREEKERLGIERKMYREGRDNSRRLGATLILVSAIGTAYGIDKAVDYGTKLIDYLF